MIVLDTDVSVGVDAALAFAGCQGLGAGSRQRRAVHDVDHAGRDRLQDRVTARRQSQGLIRITAEQVFSAFAEHVLAFDAAAAVRYGAIVSGRDRVGAPIDGFDAQIAAICRVHAATLATRNVKDFERTGVDVVDPWHDVP